MKNLEINIDTQSSNKIYEDYKRAQARVLYLEKELKSKQLEYEERIKALFPKNLDRDGVYIINSFDSRAFLAHKWAFISKDDCLAKFSRQFFEMRAEKSLLRIMFRSIFANRIRKDGLKLKNRFFSIKKLTYESSNKYKDA